jgi:hypothetical protein
MPEARFRFNTSRERAHLRRCLREWFDAETAGDKDITLDNARAAIRAGNQLAYAIGCQAADVNDARDTGLANHDEAR